MAAADFGLKEYQRAALDRLVSYLRDSTAIGANVAFYKATNIRFRSAPAVADGTPYVCLRVPTGGGKTLDGSAFHRDCRSRVPASRKPDGSVARAVYGNP